MIDKLNYIKYLMSSKYIIISGEEVLSHIIKTSQFNTNDKESNKKIIKVFEYTLLKVI